MLIMQKYTDDVYFLHTFLHYEHLDGWRPIKFITTNQIYIKQITRFFEKTSF